ncbi:MAG: DNA-processing protein DprA [Bdellovibrionales bacterium]
MDWRFDLALLLQSVLDLGLSELSESLQRRPQDLNEALDFLATDQKSDLIRQTHNINHQKQKQWLLQNNVRLCLYSESDYPRVMLDWSHAPQALWYLGAPVWNQRPSVAVVGSRNPSTNSAQWMNWRLMQFLKSRPATVVSGGARGVDQLAHWLAIREKIPTVALMPVGLQYRYPPDFFRMEPSILNGGGAILSPFRPDWPLYKANFARRNQVIAALSQITLVVEARRRSGTLLTAKAAINLDRPIGVLPCSPMSAQGLGGLDLLCESEASVLIRDDKDLILLWDRTSGSQGRIC